MIALSPPNPSGAINGITPKAAPSTVPPPPIGLTPNAATAAPATPTATPSPGAPAAFSDPSTGQITPVVGAPQGYNLGSGVDDSVSGLLPSGFSTATMTAPTTPDAASPSAASVVAGETGQLTGPTPWVVTPDQTVAGQYASLMQAGNPAIQAAEQTTLRANAQSGGNNSLMAQNAASLAGSQVALTIATADAQTQAQAGQFNAAAANTFATQQDAFVQNAALSQQNFQQGVAMLKDQTTQSIDQLYAQVQASAATASVNIKTTLANTQISTNATLETMDKTFAQTTDEAENTYANTVRTGYLSSVNTQQQALMQSIGTINANPNITSAQASAAITQAVGEFNSFMTMNNAYFSAMIPGSPTASASQYNAANFPQG